MEYFNINNKRITEDDVDKKFEDFLDNCYRCKTDKDKKLLRKAYRFAKVAHKGQTRYNGDAFINHPLEVAKIVSLDIGLSSVSSAAALVHDTMTNADINSSFFKVSFEKKYAETISNIVINLTKIKGTSNYFDKDKLGVYRKVIQSLSEDIRIIYIKIADRLHNMRTLDALEPQRKLKVANETMYVYAPLADRLGLYNIKTELQDLAFKYIHNRSYTDIAIRIKDDKRKNIMRLNRFALPIISKLSDKKFNFRIKSRQKSIYSIWQKLKRKNISIEQVYDIFAIRIIYTPKDPTKEKTDCFKIADLIKKIYKLKPDRVRNWVDNPKSNGYMALHITVKDQFDKWVEVQIRSEKMDDIAEHGLAAHWKYKGLEERKEKFDKKINEIKKKIEVYDDKHVDYSNDFKLLFTTDLYVYTPKGKEITLEVGATVLDFAFAVHTSLGFKCIGAKVNNIVRPIDYKLQSGDEVYIMTLKKQKPTPDWLKIVNTHKAKTQIKKYLREQSKRNNENLFKDENKIGKDIFNELLNKHNISPSPELFKNIRSTFKLSNKNIYNNIGNGNISKKELEQTLKKYKKWNFRNFLKLIKKTPKKQSLDNEKLTLAECCNPIPGDEVVGIKTKDGITLHRKNCHILETIKSNTETFSLTWQKYKANAYYTRLQIEAENKMGLFHKISSVLAKDLEVNIKSLHFDTYENEQNMYGWIEIYVLNNKHLKKIISELSSINGITKVERMYT